MSSGGIAESDADRIAAARGDTMKKIGLTAAEKFWYVLGA
jgi:hypothetical protein